MRRAPLCVLIAATLCSACVLTAKNFRDYKPGERIREDETVIVGSVFIDPPIENPPYFAVDLFGVTRVAFLIFSAEPDDPYDPDNIFLGMSHLIVDPGKPFVAVVKRRPKYLRAVVEYDGYRNEWVPTSPITMERRPQALYFVCSGRALVDLQPTDSVVDIGEIHCSRDEARAGFRVWPSTPEVKRRAPSPPVERLAEPMKGGALRVEEIAPHRYGDEVQ